MPNGLVPAGPVGTAAVMGMSVPAVLLTANTISVPELLFVVSK